MCGKAAGAVGLCGSTVRRAVIGNTQNWECNAKCSSCMCLPSARVTRQHRHQRDDRTPHNLFISSDKYEDNVCAPHHSTLDVGVFANCQHFRHKPKHHTHAGGNTHTHTHARSGSLFVARNVKIIPKLLSLSTRQRRRQWRWWRRRRRWRRCRRRWHETTKDCFRFIYLFLFSLVPPNIAVASE